MDLAGICQEDTRLESLQDCREQGVMAAGKIQESRANKSRVAPMSMTKRSTLCQDKGSRSLRH